MSNTPSETTMSNTPSETPPQSLPFKYDFGEKISQLESSEDTKLNLLEEENNENFSTDHLHGKDYPENAKDVSTKQYDEKLQRSFADVGVQRKSIIVLTDQITELASEVKVTNEKLKNLAGMQETGQLVTDQVTKVLQEKLNNLVHSVDSEMKEMRDKMNMEVKVTNEKLKNLAGMQETGQLLNDQVTKALQEKLNNLVHSVDSEIKEMQDKMNMIRENRDLFHLLDGRLTSVEEKTKNFAENHELIKTMSERIKTVEHQVTEKVKSDMDRVSKQANVDKAQEKDILMNHGNITNQADRMIDVQFDQTKMHEKLHNVVEEQKLIKPLIEKVTHVEQVIEEDASVRTKVMMNIAELAENVNDKMVANLASLHKLAERLRVLEQKL